MRFYGDKAKADAVYAYETVLIAPRDTTDIYVGTASHLPPTTLLRSSCLLLGAVRTL